MRSPLCRSSDPLELLVLKDWSCETTYVKPEEETGVCTCYLNFALSCASTLPSQLLFCLPRFLCQVAPVLGAVLELLKFPRRS